MSQIEEVCQALRANGIAYETKVLNVEQRGYPSNECQNLANEIVAKMMDLAKYGVNFGFSLGLKKTLMELSKDVVLLTDRKYDGKTDKIRKDYEEALAKLKLKESFGPDSIPSIIKDAFEKYLQITRIYKETATTENDIKFFTNANEKLEAMQAKLPNIWNANCAAAEEQAIRIVNGLVLYGNNVVKHITLPSTLDFLNDTDKALDSLIGMNIYEKPVKKLTIKKVNSNSIDRVLSYSVSQGKLDSIKMNLANFNKKTEDILNESTAKLNASQARLDQYNAQKQKVKSDYQNGFKSKETAARELVVINQGIEQAEKLMNRENAEFERKQQLVSSRSNSSFNVQLLLDRIHMQFLHTTDPYSLTVFMEKIDIDSLTMFLNDVPGDAQMYDNVSESIRKILSFTDVIDETAITKTEEQTIEIDSYYETQQTRTENHSKKLDAALDELDDFVKETQKQDGLDQTQKEDNLDPNIIVPEVNSNDN